MYVLQYTRKPSATQIQLTDYIYDPVRIEFDMNDKKQYRRAMKAIHTVPRRKPRKRGRKKDITTLFYKIDHFIKKGDLTLIKTDYLHNFRSIPILPLSEIEYEGITNYKKLMLEALPGFTGFFDEVVLCNNLTYFDDMQEKLEQSGVSFRNRFLHDVIIYELAPI